MSEITQTNDNTTLDIRKSIIKLFNSTEYGELKLYYDSISFFDILGVMRNENIHSNFLSWLLKKDQSHGLGEFPIKKFLEMLILALSDCSYSKNTNELFPDYLIDFIITGNYDVMDINIEREKVIDDNKRIDLFLDLKLKIKDLNPEIINLKIIIENKIYSKEHSDQTTKYYTWAENNYRNNSELIYIYLTPLSNKKLVLLEQQECTCNKYIQINYQYLVDYVLEPCRKQPLSQESTFVIDNYLRCLSYPSIDDETIKTGGSGLVMAINERERKLLLDFWEGNKALLLAMLNVLKDDDNIDEDERLNMEHMITSMSTKSSNDYTKYLFNGNQYGKNRLVLAIVNKYVEDNNATYDNLIDVFPKHLQGSHGVIELESALETKDPRRFFSKPEEVITTTDGVKIVVCNQWGAHNIEKFINAAINMGFNIENVK